MRISRLELQKVACFDHLCIDFKEGADPKKADVHLIVGADGTGKSTILMAPAQFFDEHNSTGLDKRFVGRDSVALLTTSNRQLHALTPRERKEEFRLEGVKWDYGSSSPLGFYYSKLPAIRDLFPNAQVFISTHSPFVIASADDAWIYSLVKSGPHSILGEVIPGMKGNSYATILKDALGVTAEFSAQVEDLLTQFYEARDKALQGDSASMDEMIRLKERLANFGEEVNAVVLPELRQTERRIGKIGGGAR